MDEDHLLRFLITTLSRVGMILVHISVIPSKSVNLICFQHILNLSVGTMCFLCFGYKIGAMQDLLDLSGGWLLNDYSYSFNVISSWRLQVLCEGLISIAIAGKAHFISDLTVIVITSTIVQPLMKNIITYGTKLNNMAVKAFNFNFQNSETEVLHILPGSIAFSASVIFGKRVLNMKDMDISSISINAQSFSLLGYTLITVGFIENSELIKILFAFSTGTLAMIILLAIGRAEIDYWECVWILQSGLAAIIGTSFCITPYEVIYTAFLVILVSALAAKIIRMIGIEDQCNIISIHAVSGSFSLIAAPFSSLGKSGVKWQEIISRFLLAIFIFCIGMLSGFLSLFLFKPLGLLRNKDDLHNITQELPISEQKLKKRNLQPGSHTHMRIKKYFIGNDTSLSSKTNTNL